MQRVLDLDLDFFVQPVVFDTPADGSRPSDDKYAVELDWETELCTAGPDANPERAAIAYLRERALLAGPLPGAAVEHHDEVFHHWQALIDAGVLRAPFHVTHMDAHGDLGTGWERQRLVFDMLGVAVADRPARSRKVLTFGDYLAFAVACQWVGTLDYVYCPKGGDDVPLAFWENFGRPNWSSGRATGQSGSPRWTRTLKGAFAIGVNARPRSTPSRVCRSTGPSSACSPPRSRSTSCSLAARRSTRHPPRTRSSARSAIRSSRPNEPEGCGAVASAGRAVAGAGW